MRALIAASIIALSTIPTKAGISDQHTPSIRSADHRAAGVRKHVRHVKRHHARRHHRHVARRHGAKRNHLALAGFPAPLVAKVREIERSCGSAIISAYRPGARIAGSGRQSNHAIRKAVDMAGNPRCIYAHLKHWPGGYSTDYGRVRHVHISYNRNKEWGVRFAHYGGHHRYARLHRRTYGYGG